MSRPRSFAWAISRHLRTGIFDEAFSFAALRKAETTGRPAGSREWLEKIPAKTGKALLPGKRNPEAEEAILGVIARVTVIPAIVRIDLHFLV